VLHRFVLERLCRARERLRESDDAKLSISAIAKEAGFSTYHFIRLFQSVFGVTPHQFRIQARLERAQRLLAAVPGRLEYKLYLSCFTLMACPAGAAIFEKRTQAALADSSRRRASHRSVRRA
jgi:AraC-type DNA-binding domain-containing proteins